MDQFGFGHVHVDQTNNLDVDCKLVVHEVLDASLWVLGIFAENGGLPSFDQGLEYGGLVGENILQLIGGALDEDLRIGVLSDEFSLLEDAVFKMLPRGMKTVFKKVLRLLEVLAWV